MTEATQLAKSHVRAIANHEFGATRHALQLGVLLWQAKACIEHGNFKKWIAVNMPGRKYSACSYYMKLAFVFAEKTRCSYDEWELLPGYQEDANDLTSLGLKDKLTDFVGEHSLTELLIKHGIRGVGLKSALDAEEQRQLPPAEAEQRQLELVWSQSFESAKTLRQLLADAATVTRLTAEQRATLASELEHALESLRRAA